MVSNLLSPTDAGARHPELSSLSHSPAWAFPTPDRLLRIGLPFILNGPAWVLQRLLTVDELNPHLLAQPPRPFPVESYLLPIFSPLLLHRSAPTPGSFPCRLSGQLALSGLVHACMPHLPPRTSFYVLAPQVHLEFPDLPLQEASPDCFSAGRPFVRL